ncbi:uncharacterized protein [Ptychodera flava]|uniref:uncharacterized protein n=1 Tax=Ptychodera flava TaxID=63121 RepID=UPI00396AAA64
MLLQGLNMDSLEWKQKEAYNSSLSCIDADSRTIEVIGFNPTTSIDTLELYFRKCRVGITSNVSIKECTLKDASTLIVMFVNAADLHKVLDMGKHEVKGARLALKITPDLPRDDKSFVLEGLQDGTTRDELADYLDFLSQSYGEPKFFFGETHGMVLVTYTKDIQETDYSKIERLTREREFKGGCDVRVRKVLKSNCVLIDSLPPDVSEEDIIQCFENVSDSDQGCIVHEVKIMKKKDPHWCS